MKITDNSKKLLSFFHKYNCLPHIKQNKTTNDIFKQLFYEIDKAIKFVKQLDKSLYNLKIKTRAELAIMMREPITSNTCIS